MPSNKKALLHDVEANAESIPGQHAAASPSASKINNLVFPKFPLLYHGLNTLGNLRTLGNLKLKGFKSIK